MLDGFSTRDAWALCTFAYSSGPGAEPILFEGRTEGKIVSARGPPKFGWDPIFEAEDTGLTCVYPRSRMSQLTRKAPDLQIRGDGRDTKERDFTSGTCAAEASRAFTSARDTKRGRILMVSRVEILDDVLPPSSPRTKNTHISTWATFLACSLEETVPS
jgi:Ham1 family